MAKHSQFFYTETISYDDEAVAIHLTLAVQPSLVAFRDYIDQLKIWDKESLHQSLVKISEQFAIKLGAIAQPLRVAMTGTTISPPIDETLVLIGRLRVLARLNQALDRIARERN